MIPRLSRCLHERLYYTVCIGELLAQSLQGNLLLSLHLSAMTARMRPMTSFCALPLLLQSPASSKASAMLQQQDGVVNCQQCFTGCKRSMYMLSDKLPLPAYLLVCGISTASSETDTTMRPLEMDLLATTPRTTVSHEMLA